MGNGCEYIFAVFVYWWALIPSGVFAVDSTLEYFWEGYRRWLDRYITKENRRTLIFVVSVLGIFLAGFLAWRDEHLEVKKLQAGSATPRLGTAEIARTIGKLQRSERVTELEGDNTIVLQYDPVPETVRLFFGDVAVRVLDEKDCRLDGRKIIVRDHAEDAKFQKLSYIKKYLAEGDIKVEYLRQPE